MVQILKGHIPAGISQCSILFLPQYCLPCFLQKFLESADTKHVTTAWLLMTQGGTKYGFKYGLHHNLCITIFSKLQLS